MAGRASTKPRKLATQARAKETVRALVQAAARIVASEGLEAFNTNHVAEVAGVGIGSLYQYFPSKEALLGAVIEARLAEDTEAARAIIAHPTDSAPERAVALVDLLCDRQRQGAPLLQVLLPLVTEVERDQLVARAMAALGERFRELLLEDPALLREDLRDPDALDIALFVVSSSLRWSTNEAVAARPELLADDRFRAELRGLVRRLFCDEAFAPR